MVEINTNNIALEESGKFFDKPKPVQSVVAQTMFQQGLIKDNQRGPITSSSQRESPSAVYGISTPGAAVYQGGMKFSEVQKKIDAGTLKPQDNKVIGRVGGHTMVMDDGDINGNDRLIRFRTTSGHQITMSDTGNFFYIVHANGLSWFELGSEGTLDVYATNSINLRTRGDINLHADRDINMFAGRNFSVKATENIHLEAMSSFTATAQDNLNLYSKSYIGVKSDGSLALDSTSGSWSGGSAIVLQAGGIDLNGPGADTVDAPDPLTTTLLDDTTFNSSVGWEVQTGGLESIVSRAPTHEPYPYHNKGVNVKISLEEGGAAPPPSAIPVPADVEVTRTE